MSIHRGTGVKALITLTPDKACNKYIALSKRKIKLKKDLIYREIELKVAAIEKELKDYKKYIVVNAKNVDVNMYELKISHRMVPSYSYDQIVLLKHRKQILMPLQKIS